jgi:hypothetical protein
MVQARSSSDSDLFGVNSLIFDKTANHRAVRVHRVHPCGVSDVRVG